MMGTHFKPETFYGYCSATMDSTSIINNSMRPCQARMHYVEWQWIARDQCNRADKDYIGLMNRNKYVFFCV